MTTSTLKRYRLQFPATATDTPTGSNLLQITQIVLRAVRWERLVTISASRHTTGGLYVRNTSNGVVGIPYALLSYTQGGGSGVDANEAFEVPCDIPLHTLVVPENHSLYASARGGTPASGVLILSVAATPLANNEGPRTEQTQQRVRRVVVTR